MSLFAAFPFCLLRITEKGHTYNVLHLPLYITYTLQDMPFLLTGPKTTAFSPLHAFILSRLRHLQTRRNALFLPPSPDVRGQSQLKGLDGSIKHTWALWMVGGLEPCSCDWRASQRKTHLLCHRKQEPKGQNPAEKKTGLSPLFGLGKLSCRWKTTFSTKCWMLLCSGPRTNTIQSWVKPSTVGFFLTWARWPSSSFTWTAPCKMKWCWVTAKISEKFKAKTIKKSFKQTITRVDTMKIISSPRCSYSYPISHVIINHSLDLICCFDSLKKTKRSIMSPCSLHEHRHVKLRSKIC